jgi:hypothetical protein
MIVVATLFVSAAAVATSAEQEGSGPATPRWLTTGERGTRGSGRVGEPAAAVDSSAGAVRQTPWPSSVELGSVRHVLDRWRINAPAQVGSLVAGAIVAAFAVVFYLKDIGRNPAGLFCDEAEIGLEAFRLLRADAEIASMPLFYRHFGYDLGFLGPAATAPFVAVFGRDDLGVRLASAIAALATLVVIYCTLRRLRVPFAMVAVAVYAFSPIVIHLSRVNFGHAPSLLLIALGFDRFVVARQSNRRMPAAIAGILLGASAYGNASFYVAAPLIVLAIGCSEILYNGRQIRAYATYGVTAGFAAIWGIPLAVRALTDDTFWLRFREKNEVNAPWFTLERFGELVDNYAKYFSKAFLFDVGEVGLPGSFISRHSVPGAGVLADIALPVVLFGVVSWFVLRSEPQARFILPWIIVAVLYPLPDLISTNDDLPPYTMSLLATSICVPYLAGWAMRGLQSIAADRSRWRFPNFRRRRAPGESAVSTAEEVSTSAGLGPTRAATTVAAIVLVWALVAGWQFFDGAYRRYPDVSANYWGWQFGPRPMIDYFVEHEDEYDEFIMDGNFNEAFIFLDFYIRDPDVRRRASIGDLSRLDPTKRQLFGVRAEVWDRIPGSQFPSKSYFVIAEVIEYPNGDDAMYLVELR